MRFLKSASISFALVLALGLFTQCSKKDVVEDEGGGSEFGASESTESGASTAPVDSAATSPVGTEGAGDAGTVSGEFKTIYFDFDSYRLRDDARDALKANANWLQANPSAAVQIEGHCDERGTTEYNMALGERRANAVKEFLMKLGIDRGRLSVISYGEERPIDPGHTESAWSRNRRAQLVSLSK